MVRNGNFESSFSHHYALSSFFAIFFVGKSLGFSFLDIFFVHFLISQKSLQEKIKKIQIRAGPFPDGVGRRGEAWAAGAAAGAAGRPLLSRVRVRKGFYRTQDTIKIPV
jgi:hypothetical protein